MNTANHNKLPSIVVTGASGFIGHYFVESVIERFRLFCIARKSQAEVGIPYHDNILWIQVDISNSENINKVAQSIKEYGGADYVIHLAGYYDFTYKDHPEYENTNIKGTQNILELSKVLGIKRFLFASSLAACKFFHEEKILDEQSPADADFKYAYSKRICEEMLKEYSSCFPCTIMRFAAVFSDWGEYPPLYKFLDTWLSRKWNSRVLGGKGESSITYIHINDLIKFFLTIIERTDKLPVLCTYIASPSGTVSHNDLFESATKYFYGHSLQPIRMPKPISFFGLIMMSSIGKLFGKEPFERPWMIKYIDKKMRVETIFTNRALSWRTTQRYDIIRRLLFIIEKIKTNRIEWMLRNEAILASKTPFRPNIIAYNLLSEQRETIVAKMLLYISLPENKERYPHYQCLDIKLLALHVRFIFQLIAITIRSKDRLLIKNYAYIIVHWLFIEKIEIDEFNDFMLTLVNMINNLILSDTALGKKKKEIYEYANTAIQLTLDEMDEHYEYMISQTNGAVNMLSQINTEELKRILRKLEDPFLSPSEYPGYNNVFEH